DVGVLSIKAELGRDPEALAEMTEMTESDIVEEEEDASEQIQALEKQITVLKKRQAKA
ncbi:unnamed protein product, partial [Durusdinium trenchii]